MSKIKFPLLDYKEFFKNMNVPLDCTKEYFRTVSVVSIKKLLEDAPYIEYNEDYYVTGEDILVDKNIENADELRKELLRPVFSEEARLNFLVSQEILWNNRFDLAIRNLHYFFEFRGKKYISINEYNYIMGLFNILAGEDNFLDSVDIKTDNLDCISDEAVNCLNGFSLTVKGDKYGSISLLKLENFLDTQSDVRMNPETGELKDTWPGNNFYVVGYDSSRKTGKAYLLIDVNNKNNPVYLYNPEDSEIAKPLLICDKFVAFVDCLKTMKEYRGTSLEMSFEQKTSVKNRILEITEKSELDEYWKNFIGEIKEEKVEKTDSSDAQKVYEIITKFKDIDKKRGKVDINVLAKKIKDTTTLSSASAYVYADFLIRNISLDLIKNLAEYTDGKKMTPINHGGKTVYDIMKEHNMSEVKAIEFLSERY